MKTIARYLFRRFHFCVVPLFLVASPMAAEPVRPASELPLSRISVTAQVEKAAIQRKLREVFTESVSDDWRQTKRELDLKAIGRVGAVIRYQTRAGGLTFSADKKGNLGLKIPITVVARPSSSGLAKLGVRTEGCGRTDFHLNISFVSSVVDERLVISKERLWADSGGYVCVMRPSTAGTVFTLGKARRVDVAAQIRSAIEVKAGALFDGAQGRLNRILALGEKLGEMAQQPAMFGSGVTVGIELHRFVPNRLYADTRWLKLDGVVQGQPWLGFGGGMARSAVPLSSALEGQGFHLPALLLFPTRSASAAAAETGTAAARGADGYGLRPVPGRDDVAILQHTERGGTTEDVIWLSGGTPPTVPKTRYFEQPLTGVLEHILEWLNEPYLWKEVPGVEALKAEVTSFRRLVEHFQEETRLALDGGRGELHFSQLSLDLVSVRVGREAIWAEVVLRGQAGLEINYPL